MPTEITPAQKNTGQCSKPTLFKIKFREQTPAEVYAMYEYYWFYEREIFWFGRDFDKLSFMKKEG